MSAKSENSVIIASDLRTGLCVYLSVDTRWVSSIDDAQVLDAADAETRLETALVDEKNNLVVDPYLIGVDRASVALDIRERIRANGPSIFNGRQVSRTEAA